MTETNSKAADPSKVLGSSIPRTDAREKACGRALYVADLQRPNMLYGKAVRSPFAHARIKQIDSSQALTCQGVLSVLTAKDIPGKNITGPRVVKDQPVLASDRVRFAGEAVALVVAETEAAARRGAAKVKVEYEPLPVVDDPESALAPDAPLLHEKGNLCFQSQIVRGNFEAAIRKADLVITRTYRTPFADHSAMEPDGAVAERQGDGILVWVTSKGVHLDREEIARVLGLPLEKVQVVAATIGGSFGSKPDHPSVCMAAVIAWKMGRPAKVVLSREECFQAKTKRHPYTLTYTHAVCRDGKILGVKVRALADAGAYASYTSTVATRGLIQALGPYAASHVDLEVRAAFTNHPITGAFRGYGLPQFIFAVERQMDLIARELDLDPWEVRMRNVLQPGDQLVTGESIAYVPMQMILEKGQRETEAIDEKDRIAGHLDPSPRFKRAWGMGTVFYGLGRTGIADSAEVVLRLEKDGCFHLFVGSPDTGQGSDTCMAMIAAEELGVPLHLVRITSADTRVTLDSGTTTATRVTYIVGNAVKDAATGLKKVLLSSAEEKELVPDQGWLADLAGFCRSRGVKTEYTGRFVTPSTALDQNGQGIPYGTYAYGAQWTRVRVDTWTWKADVERVVTCCDVGHIINPLLLSGQIEGAVVMAQGYGLTEEVLLRNGAIVNPNFDEYLLPTAADVPPITQIILETHETPGPFGATGIGEPAAVPGAASIANAVSRALGIEVSELPVTPERIWRLVEMEGPETEGGTNG